MKRKIEQKIILTVIAAVLIILLFTPFYQSSLIKYEKTGFPVGWSDDYRLTNSISPDAYPSISIYQDDVHLVWRDIWGGDGRIFYTNSTDGGQIWSNHRQLNIGGDGGYPDIGTNTTNLHVIYNDNLGVSNKEIAYCNSTDGGISWSSPKYISVDDGFNSEGAKIAVNNSCIHVIWVDQRLGGVLNQEIFYKRSTDGGITWDDALGNPNLDRRITHDLSGTTSIGMAINQSNLHVIFIDDRDGTFDVYYTRSVNNGVTWDNGTGTVDEERILTTNATDHGSPTIAVNGSTIHVAWVDTLPGPVYYMFYRNSTDNGFSWNPIQLLSGPSPVISRPELFVQNDEIEVVWADFRDDGSTSEIYNKNSTDGGVSWNPDVRITYNESFDSWMPKISKSNNVKHVIWYDERDGNNEIYYKRYPDFPTDTTPPTITHNPIPESPINQPIGITANITDDFEVSNVTLYYENVGDTTYTAVDMSLSGNWTATIPTQAETGLAHYFIWANDTSGNNITSPIIGDYAIQITGPPSIEVTNIIGGEDWTGGSIHQIEFTASDTEDAPAVLDVFLNYTSIIAGNGTIAQINGDDSPYDWTLPIIDTSDVKINATVIDSDGNKEYDYSLEFTIDSSPPEVISTNPVNNTTGISIFQPVIIQFNEPMDSPSVIVNQTNGTDPGGWSWFWNEDKDTITGIHDSWLRGETIEITVQENYSDDSDPGNVNNTEYVFSFTTETNPSPEIIVQTNTSASKELGEDQWIVATITDDGTVMNAVLWWQDVDGNWHENNMQRNVGGNWEYLLPGQMTMGKVRFQINATDDLEQKNMTMIYEFDIRDSTPPVIIHTPVESAIVGEAINITCEITDLGGVDITYMSSGVFFVYRYEGDTDFIFRVMDPEYWYEIPAHSVPATIEYYIWASDIYGNDASTNVFSLEILDPDTTPPEVLLATPIGNDVPISTDISIVFSEAVNKTAVEGAISVSPTLTGISYNWLDNQTLVIEISGNLSYNTTYTVTIDTGAKDLAGNTLANDYSWQFSTAEESEIVQPPASNNYGWIGIVIFLISIIVLLMLTILRDKKEQE